MWWQHLWRSVPYGSQLLRHQFYLSFAKWGASGFARSFGQVALKFGAQRVALGAATTGVTGVVVHRQLRNPSDGEDEPVGGEVLSEGELEWLNAAVKPLWDHLNAGLQKLIREEIEPALQQSVPVVGRFLHFTRLTLGEKAPRLGPVMVTRSTHGMELSIDFEFAGDLEVEFSAGVASLEVIDVVVRGSLQVALRPLVDAINPVGGITISCLDRPSLDLSLRADIVKEAVPNIYDFVRETVDDVVAGLIVVPNSIVGALPTGGPPTDWSRLRWPTPAGVLNVTVHSVVGSVEAPVLGAYVHMHIGADTWSMRSSRGTSRRDLSSWSQDNQRTFIIYSERQCVDVRCFSASHIGLDSFLGRARVPLLDIIGADSVTVKLTLKDGSESDRAITLSCKWLPVMHDLPEPPPDSAPCDEGFDTLLSVQIDSLSKLQHFEDYTHHVRVRSGDQVEETHEGDPPSSEMDHVSDGAFLEMARKLVLKLSIADLANAMQVSEHDAREFAELHARDPAADLAASEAAWAKRARERSRHVAASQHPHYHHVFHFPTNLTNTVIVEVVKCKHNAAGGDVVASLRRPLHQILDGGGVLQGPFSLRLAGTDEELSLNGSMRLRRLGHALERPAPMHDIDDLHAAQGQRAQEEPKTDARSAAGKAGSQ